MDQTVLSCFVKSALNVLGSELGTEISIGQPFLQANPYTTQEVTSLVGVTGGLRGMVLFGLSEHTALSVVSRMIGMPFEALDDVAQSGIAELGNVVVGASVTCLEADGRRCGITPPAVVLGKDTKINTLGLQRLVVPLSTSLGPIEMQLALRENGIH